MKSYRTNPASRQNHVFNYDDRGEFPIDEPLEQQDAAKYSQLPIEQKLKIFQKKKNAMI